MDPESGAPVTRVEPSAADPEGALRRAWLVAAGLILCTTLVLYLAHDQAIPGVLSWTGSGFPAADDPDDAFSPDAASWSEETDGDLGEE